MIRLHTIGFTNKSAEHFFRLIRERKVKKVIDVRLNVRSQLSGFAKGDDLRYFLPALSGAEYEHHLELAPDAELLKRYRSGDIDWCEYAKRYTDLLDTRNIVSLFQQHDLHQCCFLCSEHSPEKCHRRVLAEYLRNSGWDVEIEHLW